MPTQTYGVAPDHEYAEVEPQEVSASSPLLGRDTAHKPASEEENGLRGGHARVMSSVGNLSNTIIGTGMLTFPLSMASSGLLPGILTCLLSACLGAFGLYLLTVAARRTPHRRASFFAVSQLTFPKAAVFFDAAIAIKCFGVSISYLIIIKGLMPNVVASLYHDLLAGDPPPWSTSGRLWIMIFMAALIPLSFLRRLDSLRHASYVGVFAAVYLVIIVVFCYFHPLKGMPEPGPIYWVHFNPMFIATFPVQVFAFTCAQNIFPIYNELICNSQKRMNIIVGTSIGSAALVYEFIAVFGYLTFGTNVGSNIIAMYPSTSLVIALGQLAIVITVMLSYPLQIHPARGCLDKVFTTVAPTKKKLPVSPAEDDEDEVDEINDAAGVHGKYEMTVMKHTLLTSCLITFGFLIAYFVDDLQLVLSFVGSTGSTTISFILPGIFFWRLFRNDPHTNKILTWSALALSGYGVLIFFFCLSYNIYKVIYEPIG